MNILRKYLKNLPGKTMSRKIIVFESDDWGSIRMPSKNVYNSLLSKGINVDKCHYNRYDSLENANDLNALAEVLKSVKDKNSNPAVFTANFNVANPDYEEIKKSNFDKYYYELFTDSYEKFYPKQDILKLTLDLYSEKLFYPQLHGREHLNPDIWMDLLNNGNDALKKAFDYGVYGLSFNVSNTINKPFLASLLYENKSQKLNVQKSIYDASKIFEQKFGFVSKTFIAPLYYWHKDLEITMKHSGIDFLQGADRQKQFDNSTKRIFNNFGKTNELGQTYLVRNVSFELSGSNKQIVLNNTLKEINISFRMKKPAVICSHRVNFMGGIQESNRKENLEYLKILLKEIVNKWPDVEFMSSEQLGKLIKNEY